MTDLAAWLTQILDEDEKIAESAVGDVATAAIDNYGHLTVPASWLLADIAAKRARIALHAPVGDGVQHCGVCRLTSPCRTLRLEASAYADRPGYDEAWRP